MSRFKVGDRVVIVCSLYPSRIGEVATIVAIQPGPTQWLWPDGSFVITNDEAHDLDLLPIPIPGLPDVPIAYPASHLEPYRDDGQEKGEWTEELRHLCKGEVDA